MNGQIPQTNVAHLISQMTNPMERFGSWADRFGEKVRAKERQEMLDKERADEREHQRIQEALANKRADEHMAMQKEQFDMRKKEFDTMQNTLRATALGTTTFDKASLGQALLDKQAASIGGSDGNGNFNNKLLQESQALAAKYQPITNADGTSTAVEMNKADAARFKAIQDELGSQADKMIAANKGNMQVQKQLIGEVGNQYFKEGEDGPMLYDPTSLNKYKQDLLQGLDARIDREAARAQQAELERARLAQDAKQHNDRMRQQAAAIKRQEELQKEELDRGAAWQKSLIAPEKKTHKMYEAKFGTEVIIPANEAKAEYIKDVRSNLNKLPGMSILRKDGMKVSVDEKTGAVKVLAIPGRKVDPSDIADVQQNINDKISVLTEKTRSKYESYLPALRNPEAFNYKLSSKKYYDSSIPNAVKVSGESYIPQYANFVEDPKAYVKEMQRQLLAGVDAYGNPLTPADIIIRRELLSSAQMKNAEVGSATSKNQDKIFSK